MPIAALAMGLVDVDGGGMALDRAFGVVVLIGVLLSGLASSHRAMGSS